MADIVIPSLGIEMEGARVVRWLKQPGDEVMADEGVAEIETDKAIVEVKSPTAGTLGAPLVELGAEIPVATVIARVIPKSEQDAPESKREQNATDAGPVRVTQGSLSPHEAIAGSTGETEGARQPHTLSPRARRLTQER